MKSVPPVPEPAGGRLMQVRQGTDARRAWGDILDRSDAY